MTPNFQRNLTPRQIAENRVRLRKRIYWVAVAIPVALAVMMLGYSDQAPAWLRSSVASLDATFGFPILALLRMMAS